jgi:hypothetical protein
LAETGNIRGLRAKKFGKRCFLKFRSIHSRILSFRSPSTPRRALSSRPRRKPRGPTRRRDGIERLISMQRKFWNVQKMFRENGIA